MRVWVGTAAACAAVLTMAGGCGGGSAANKETAAPAGNAQAAAVQQDFVQVVHQVLPSVVQITTTSGLGSGVILDTQGNIVTNAHVVGEAQQFQVSLATGGKPLAAKLVASYPQGDLAVIKIDNPPTLTPATFADSSKLQVGQIVLAMGNPLGYSGSVTNGIVSGLQRTVTEPRGGGSPGATIAGAIQTSAAINPGNSGGALVDLAGQVVGIPTLAALDPELGDSAAPGIGFAIPSNTAKDIAAQIVKDGKVSNTRRAALGIRGVTVVGPDGKPAGVGVARVQPDGGAAKGGIQAGDIITAVNGTSTPTNVALAEVLAQLKPGDTVKVDVTHPDGGKATVNVTLGELPAS